MAPGSRRNVLRMGINMVVLGVLLFLCFFEEVGVGYFVFSGSLQRYMHMLSGNG